MDLRAPRWGTRSASPYTPLLDLPAAYAPLQPFQSEIASVPSSLAAATSSHQTAFAIAGQDPDPLAEAISTSMQPPLVGGSRGDPGGGAAA